MKLTQQELFEIITNLKPSKTKRPDVNLLSTHVAAMMDVKLCDDLKNIMKKQLLSYKRARESRTDGNSDVVVDSGDYESTAAINEAPIKKRKSLDNLSRKQILRRTDEQFKSLEKFASDEGIELARVLGLFLTRCKTKSMQDIGNQIWLDGIKETPNQLPVQTSLTIYHDCNLGRQTYTQQRRIMSKTGVKVFPPWSHLRKMQSTITPVPVNLPAPYIGVHYPLSEAVKMTVSRIFKTIPNEKLADLGPIVKHDIKFGFDGSGSHSLYNQKNNVDTSNIIITMICPLKIANENGMELWTQLSPNSPLTQRPISLQMGKESATSLRSLEIFNQDITDLQTDGFLLEHGGKHFNVHTKIQGCMMDMKAAHLYSGLGGCYCDLCSYTKLQCVDREIIEEGFTISRDIDDIHSRFNMLVQDDGTILKKRNDYDVREGMTTKPISTNQFISQQVLHSLLRNFDHFMKAAVHVKAGVIDWSESPSSINKQFLERAKTEIQERIKTDIHGIKWDVPDSSGKGGTSTTGNVARDLLHNSSNRGIIVTELLIQRREVFRIYGQHLSVILRVFSSKQKVKVEIYKEFCTNLYVFLIVSFPRVTHREKPGPWISITPALHKLLGHSWELIQLNEGFGLGNLDESGLEGCNKILRNIRTRLSRKNSQILNLIDTLNRMWVGSDPLINEERLKARPFCKHCDVSGHSKRYCQMANISDYAASEDDSLFDMLIDK